MLGISGWLHVASRHGERSGRWGLGGWEGTRTRSGRDRGKQGWEGRGVEEKNKCWA